MAGSRAGPQRVPRAGPWHTLPHPDGLRRLASSAGGLTGEEAAGRLSAGAANELPATPAVAPWTLLLGQFKNVLVPVLITAAALSAAMGQALEAAVIFVIL